MCRKRWVLLPLGLACARGLIGQELPRLQARADSLAREWRHAAAVADAIDSLERARVFVGHDTIRVGALTIVTNASPLPLREAAVRAWPLDRKSTRLNSSHRCISYAVFCLKKK